MNSPGARALQSRLAAFPRATLVDRPTPLDHLQHLGHQLGIDIWMKRDDLTPIALGGDKPRKLEFELGKAIADGADRFGCEINKKRGYGRGVSNNSA